MASAEKTSEVAALAKKNSESEPRGPTRFQEMEDEPANKKKTEVVNRDPSFGSSLLNVSRFNHTSAQNAPVFF
jgi:hypothetical protein